MTWRCLGVFAVLSLAVGCGDGRVEPAPQPPNALPTDLGTTLPNETVRPSEPVDPDPDPEPEPPPPPPPEIIALSGGDDFSCFLRDDGLLRCWGQNSDLKALAPPGDFIQVAAADRFACALDQAGEIVCWGWAPRIEAPAGPFEVLAVGAAGGCALDAAGAATCWGAGQLDPPADLGAVTDVAVGDGFACAIKASDGRVRCWGNGAPVANPPVVEGLLQVVAGADHACVMHPASEALCWGANTQRQTETRTGPFTALMAGFNHSCGLRADGWVCWGGLPVELPQEIQHLAVGPQHACGVLEGEVVCWGDNEWFQGSPPVLAGVAEVSVGRELACLRHVDGALSCFGEPTSDVGLEIPPEGSFEAVAVGHEHACAIRSPGGELVCWGSGASAATSPPAGRFVAVVAGLARSCAQRDDGVIVCWGNIGAPPTNLVGVQGLTLGERHACAWNALEVGVCWGAGAESTVEEGASYRNISAGWRYSIGVRPDGALFGWGADARGRTVPPAGDGYVAAAAGRLHACALHSDGSVVCWGDAPARDTPDASFTQISAGDGYACGVTTDGGLMCWGNRVR